MKLAINVGLSLVMLALCVWLVWPSPEHKLEIGKFLDTMTWARFWPYLAGYVGLLALTHFFRAWRWNHLLHPIGVWLSPMRLLAVSSVGFMAILVLPARLGEFVRPALIRRGGEVSVAAALGTVAVERIVDGLLVSIIVFIAFFSLRGPHAEAWMMPTAWAALGVFVAALGFLGFALRWPEKTVSAMVTMSLTPRFAPRVAIFLRDKLTSLISGFKVLGNPRHLAWFTFWTVLYWLANAIGLLVLARGFGLQLSFTGALATMGLTAVGITLPNAPVNAGQFQLFMMAGLSLYLGHEIAQTQGLVYALVCHGIQVVWYIGCGIAGMLSSHVSLEEIVASRKGVE